MGNHFRTSGAGDDAPKTQAGVQGSRFATPDSEGQPVAQAPAQPADQAQPASDPFCLQSNQRCRAFRHGGF
mgnify:CR=1 FL=1